MIQAPTIRWTWLYHSTSEVPSLLKSPMPATFHAAGIDLAPRPAQPVFAPLLMISAPTDPVDWLCHNTSEVPSPLKSPMPATFHAVGSTVPRPAQPLFAPLLMSSTPTNPVDWLYHNTSEVPSPLKSPTPATFHTVGSTAPRPAQPMFAPLLMSSAPTNPVDLVVPQHIRGAVAVEVSDAGHLPHRGIDRAEARPADVRAVLNEFGAHQSRGLVVPQRHPRCRRR